MGEGLTEPERPVYERHDDLVATLTRALDADPRQAPFGVLIQDPWDEGDRQFFWYPSREELEFALLDAHAFVDPDAFDEEREEWTEPQFDLDAALQEIDELSADHAEELDAITGEFFGIVWIGHFQDLGQGDDDISITLRREVRSLDERGGAAAGEDGNREDNSDEEPSAPFSEDADYDALAELLLALD